MILKVFTIISLHTYHEDFVKVKLKNVYIKSTLRVLKSLFIFP